MECVAGNDQAVRWIAQVMMDETVDESGLI
jgi:hypothetical protein